MKFEADHVGNEHDDRLAEQRRLGFDPAHAPADDAEPVDHRRMGVHADDRIRISQRRPVLLRAENHLAQVFQIHLVADAGVRRDHFKVTEGLLPPAQEGIALGATLIFDLGVEVKCLGRAEVVHLDRVVDDEIDRRERVDLFRIPSHALHRLAHHGEIHYRRHAGQILREHPRRHKGDLSILLRLGIPTGKGLNVFLGHQPAILVPQKILQKNF